MVFPTENATPAPRLVAVKPEEPIRISSHPTELEAGIDSSSKSDATREDLEPEAKRDGVTKRIRIPSWDDIMFGKKSEESEPRPE